jgi:YidC/Oxa1 family membrane protein insertase
MERRVLIAILLSFVVVYAYQALLPPEPVPPPGAARPEASSQPSAPFQPATTAAVQPPEQQAAGAAGDIQPLVADTSERDIVVESAAVRAVVTTRGAELKSWRLKKFFDQAGQPLELVPSAVPSGQPLPFALSVGDGQIDGRLRRALYRPSADRLTVGPAGSSLSFEYRDAAGLHVRKVFEFHDEPQAYLITFSASVVDGARTLNPAVQWGPGLGSSSSVTYAGYNVPVAIYFLDGDMVRLGAADLAEQSAAEGPLGFAGVNDLYFMSAAVGGQPFKVQFAPVKVPAPSGAPSPTQDLIAYSAQFPAPPSGARFFFGPKDFDVLAAVDRDLVRAIDFGIFAWLVVPLLRALKWINASVGNYGWSIIILTILINAAMFPLRHKSVVSMRRMQELQPEVKAIQDRYAKYKTTDPERQKMNVELMNLYRERKVNPASGCIPMLLTFPVLLAFYSMLSGAIELRGAPFVGWITDLSVHDPWYVTPLLMGVSMVVQQRMTPTTADPTQQKIMMAMPVVFTFMFLRMPSGLVIYWLVSNLWAIGQQVATNKIIGPPVVRTIRPAAERQLKRAGGGKSDQAKQRE